MVTHLKLVITTFIVKAVVELLVTGSLDLLGKRVACKVDVRELSDLVSLELSQVICQVHTGLPARHGELESLAAGGLLGIGASLVSSSWQGLNLAHNLLLELHLQRVLRL